MHLVLQGIFKKMFGHDFNVFFYVSKSNPFKSLGKWREYIIQDIIQRIYTILHNILPSLPNHQNFAWLIIIFCFPWKESSAAAAPWDGLLHWYGLHTTESGTPLR